MNSINYFSIIFIISASTLIAFCDENYFQINSSKESELCSSLINTINKECKISYGSYRWEDMRINFILPQDAVYGGQNWGMEPLFVVRGKGSNSSYYGKIPIPYQRKNAFLTNTEREFEAAEFQVLTAKSYSWCNPNSVNKFATKIDPICRAFYDGLLTPGTLVGNRCRVGWGKIYFYDEYEVLVVGAGCR